MLPSALEQSRSQSRVNGSVETAFGFSLYADSSTILINFHQLIISTPSYIQALDAGSGKQREVQALDPSEVMGYEWWEFLII